MSKALMTALLAATVLTVPALAHTRPLTISTTLKNYGGDGAYLAVYVTDPKGVHVRTLWVSGGKTKYYKHLSDWNRLSAGKDRALDGITGASIAAGRTLKVTTDVADTLLDTGYEIRVDAAVEKMRDSPSEIRVPLTTENAGKSHPGRQYIQSFIYELK